MLLALTPRRRETLEELRRLTEQAGGAVHYSLLAARLRVSNWSAYSLLRELERMGLVLRRYVSDPHPRGGRPRILFQPAAGTGAEPLREAFELLAAIADESAATLARLGSSQLAAQLRSASASLEQLLESPRTAPT